MKSATPTKWFPLALMLLMLIGACKKENLNPATTPEPVEYGQALLKLEHIWGENLQAFYMRQWMEHPETGDSLRFDSLRYYVSQIALLNDKGNWIALNIPPQLVVLDFNTLFLIQLSEVPVGTYEAIRFAIGIDSLTNAAGMGGGFLDPLYGMYHGPSMGYIHIKAKGNARSAPGEQFNYELCGFGQPRMVQEHFDANELLEIANAGEPAVGFYVNTAAFWDVSTRPQHYYFVHSPGPANSALSQNFGRAFIFEHLH
ncbi:MAG: MbnP family protein [Bacteroidia bacterium]